MNKLLKFKNPSEDETDDRFKVVEDRGDRVLVSPVHEDFDSWVIQPVTVLLKEDLVPAED